MSLPTASPYLTRALLAPQPVSVEIIDADESGAVEIRVGHDPRVLDVSWYRVYVSDNDEGPLYLTHAQLCALHAATAALVRGRGAARPRSAS
ncbi:MAG: hypothetical protein KF683_01290 [Rubrivivax sp.]|nr:hypothetical protein [Rubrivivax sp.]